MKIQIKGSKMNIRAIIFGSIGTLVETSDLQRQSFNQAFKEANLNWHWDSKLYQKLLSQSGGRNRIQRNHFDFIGSDTVVKKTKPSPDIYKKTLSSLKVNSHECLAIEDTEISMKSALAAGIRCVAFPGANALGDDFSGAEAITEVLTPANINI